jgi:four helix bundle protein
MGTSKASYRDLIVWQKAIDLVPSVYKIVKRFPSDENFALSQQMRRAAVSIPANIAEGQARSHRKEFCQHLSVAKGSLAELDTLFVVADRLGYLRPEEVSAIDEQIADLRRPLNALLKASQNSELRTQNS